MFNKYRAKSANGFPSKLEAAVYELLNLRQLAGEITDLKRQQTVTLKEQCDSCGAKRITWRVDFSFVENGQLVYSEAKGAETAEYLKKLRRWRENPTFKLEIWKGNYRRPFLAETIFPTNQETGHEKEEEAR